MQVRSPLPTVLALRRHERSRTTSAHRLLDSRQLAYLITPFAAYCHPLSELAIVVLSCSRGPLQHYWVLLEEFY